MILPDCTEECIHCACDNGCLRDRHLLKCQTTWYNGICAGTFPHRRQRTCRISDIPTSLVYVLSPATVRPNGHCFDARPNLRDTYRSRSRLTPPTSILLRLAQKRLSRSSRWVEQGTLIRLTRNISFDLDFSDELCYKVTAIVKSCTS